MPASVAKNLERDHIKSQRRNLIVLFEDTNINWMWDEAELYQLVDMNEEEKSIQDMCSVFNRADPDEVFLALYYLAKKGKIQKLDLRRLLI